MATLRIAIYYDVVFIMEEQTTYEFIDGHLFVFFGMHVAIRHLLHPESKIKKSKKGWPYTFEHGTPDLNYSSDAFLNVKFTRTLQAFFHPDKR